MNRGSISSGKEILFELKNESSKLSKAKTNMYTYNEKTKR